MVAPNVVAMGKTSIDINGFQKWATGNLVDNRNRGIFAEWMVGEALDCIDGDDFRVEWDSYDLRYGDIKVEVKASGLSQTWNPDNATIPRFTITGQKWTWLTEEEAEVLPDHDPDAHHRRSGVWLENIPPSRPSDVYVFCLHEALPATNANVADPSEWTFWVIATKALDAAVGSQKSVGLKALDGLAQRIPWNEIRAAVDDCQSA